MSTARERTLELQGRKPSAQMGAVRIVVDGQDVIVDAATFTGKERQAMKKALATLGYTPDEEDHLFAAIWITLRRSEPAITFDAVCESVTIGDLADATRVDPDEDDSPEA